MRINWLGLAVVSGCGNFVGGNVVQRAGGEATSSNSARAIRAVVPASDVATLVAAGSLFSSWLGADPFKLPQPGVLQDMGIHVGGWLQAGITAKQRRPDRRVQWPPC